MADTVLVTGGAGYIGSHTCMALAREGYRPVVFDNLSSGHEWAVQWGPLESGDTRDGARLAEVIRAYRPVAVMHFAADIAAGESVVAPAKYYDNNVGGALTVLQTMLAEGVDRFVFSSTAAVYGDPTEVPIPETHPLAPLNPYGQSKLMVEHMLSDFARAYGLRSVALRYFNAAGSDPEGRIGEAHDPETHLIPLVLEAARDKDGAVKVFGTDYPTRDGTCIRDYVHVSDLADAHVLALARLAANDGASVFNLGNGAGFTVREVIDAARTVTGGDIRVETVDRRPGDSAVLVARSERAIRELGWTPRYEGIETQIDHAWRWLSARP